jgi:gas vesicle protein
MIMKDLLYFIAGAAVGAVVALLFAPSSGEELRARMGQEAAAERQKIQAEYEKNLQLVHDRIDHMHQDLSAKFQQGKQGDVEVTEGTEKALAVGANGFVAINS